MPAIRFLELGTQLGPIQTFGCSGCRHRFIDAGLHSTQTAHVDMGLGVFDHGEDLVGVLKNPVLDVHATAFGILLFTADRLGVTEVLGELLLVMEEVLVVEQVAGLGCTHEQPGLATERPTVGIPFTGFEHAADVGAHWGDARACGQHDDVGVFVGREKHLLADRTGDLHLRAGLDVAEVGGADAVDLFASVVLVLELTHTQGNRVVLEVVAVAGAGDRVKAEFVRFAVGIFALRNDADALTLDVFQLRLATGEIEGDVLHPADAAVLHQGVVLGHRAEKRGLRLVGVDGNVCVGLFLRGGSCCHGLRGGVAGGGHRCCRGVLASR